MKNLTLGVAVLIVLSCANPARADAIYDFSLPANGAVSAFDIALTFPDLLSPGGLLVIPVTAPVVTSLTFDTPGFDPGLSVIGLQITATQTLFGLAMFNPSAAPLLLTVNFPGDFFVFNRAPGTTGTFTSISGNVVSVLPTATGSPVGTLSVTETSAVPEPSTVSLFGVSLLFVAAVRRWDSPASRG